MPQLLSAHRLPVPFPTGQRLVLRNAPVWLRCSIQQHSHNASPPGGVLPPPPPPPIPFLLVSPPCPAGGSCALAVALPNVEYVFGLAGEAQSGGWGARERPLSTVCDP